MEENNNKQLIELLNQLMQIQSQLAAVISTKFERQTEDDVKDNIQEKNDSISNEARRYGQDPSFANEAISEYEDALSQIKEEYSTEKNLWLAELEEFQGKEIQYTLEIEKLRSQLEQADYRNRKYELKQEMKKARELSKESKDNIKDCQDRWKKEMNEIREDKDLAIVDNKQNIFSKLFSKIMNRIGGKEKLSEIGEKISDKIGPLTER